MLNREVLEVGAPVSERISSPTVSFADIEKVLAVALRYGLEIIPPPAESSQI
ncbi:hypothetical protein [Nostoc sp. C117]|uniref:hypothetical protein n=1 Tax=Nostoc sp. C117 TaxID=3349875 RepID=UPI00370D4487